MNHRRAAARPSTVHYRHSPASTPAGLQVITILDGDGRYLGQLDYQICRTCHRGHIHNIAVADHWQNQGLGREAIHRALRHDEPLAWSTSRQSNAGRAFFAVMAEETGHDFRPAAERCPHMAAAATATPPPDR